jgi:cyclohexanecarboxylate-CoA ligase
MEEHQVSVIGGAPVFLNGMLRSSKFADYDTSALRAFLLGGDTVPPSVVEAADAVGWTAVRAYGLTEHPSISMGSFGEPLEIQANTDGCVVELTDVRIVDDDGNDLEHGVPGEVWVRGPGQCIGLIAGDEIMQAADDEGWLHTGDLAVVDENSRLTIKGRLKDVIIRGGEKISCSEVETAILQHPDVVDVCVAGMPDPFAGQRVVAFVVPRGSANPGLPDIARHCIGAGLAGHKVPKRLHRVEGIPRSLLGKVQRYQLVDAVTEGAMTVLTTRS